MKILNLDKPIIQWLLLLLLAFVWGSSFILMKRGLETFSNFQVASLRIAIAYFFLLPIAIKNLRKIKGKYWGYLLIAGLLGNGIPAFLFTTAQTQISSSLTGMLNSLVPLFTVLVGLIGFGLKLRIKRFAGVLLGLVGAIGLLSVQGLNFGDSNLAYALLVVLATICYATNINFIKTYLGPINSIDITAFGFFFLGPPVILYLFMSDFYHIMQSDPEATTNLFYIALLSVFGTALAVILFNILIKKVSAVYASSVTYIIPIFALMWGFIDGEVIKGMHILWISVILSGIYIVNRENLKLNRKAKKELKPQNLNK
ncbi:DMT family transporter [bacterium]|jgi:drug/metabolite transporter (DMT)-like permease|nr:DMT family transporter [bacterium]